VKNLAGRGRGARTMTKAVGRKSLVDQIIDAWLEKLRDTQEFDTSTIERLEHLASRRALGKPAQVMQVIKITSGGPE
jgi:hypothetical protein